MKIDLDDAIASAQEVAAFAWSLTELLFTRILPLLGFLVAQLLLQAGRTALDLITASSSSPSARRRRSWISDEQQQQPLSSPALVQPSLPSPTYSTMQTAPQYVDSSLKYCEPYSPRSSITPRAEFVGHAPPQAVNYGSPDLFESVPLSVASRDAIVGSGNLEQPQALAAQGTLAASQDQEQSQPASVKAAIATLESSVTHSTDAQSAADPFLEESHQKPALPEASPTAAIVSDEQERHGEGDVPPPEPQSAHAVQSTQSDLKPVDATPEMTLDATKPSQPERHEESRSSNAELRADGPAGHVAEPDCEAEAKPLADSAFPATESMKRRQFTRRKSLSQTRRHPFSKVLPPSLSQIKRTIMQRSRRGSRRGSPSPTLKKTTNLA